MIDLKCSGVVNIEALKFFIKSLWADKEMNNLKLGFDFIDRTSQANRGFVDLDYVKDLNQRYPQVTPLNDTLTRLPSCFPSCFTRCLTFR